jgi:hypothetical protein
MLKKEVIVPLLTGICLLALWGSLIHGCSECESRGGTYAKTLGGYYQCIDPKK